MSAESTFNDETRLLFYALHKQATAGPCKEAKPWSWNVVESAKWQSWNQLGAMSGMDAMRLYVKTLDDEQVCMCMRTFQPSTMAVVHSCPLSWRDFRTFPFHALTLPSCLLAMVAISSSTFYVIRWLFTLLHVEVSLLPTQ